MRSSRRPQRRKSQHLSPDQPAKGARCSAQPARLPGLGVRQPWPQAPARGRPACTTAWQQPTIPWPAGRPGAANQRQGESSHSFLNAKPECPPAPLRRARNDRHDRPGSPTVTDRAALGNSGSGLQSFIFPGSGLSSFMIPGVTSSTLHFSRCQAFNVQIQIAASQRVMKDGRPDPGKLKGDER